MASENKNINSLSIRVIIVSGLLAFFLFAALESIITAATIGLYRQYYALSLTLWFSIGLVAVFAVVGVYSVLRKVCNQASPILLVAVLMFLPHFLYLFLQVMIRMPEKFYSFSTLLTLLLLLAHVPFLLLAYVPFLWLTHSYLKENEYGFMPGALFIITTTAFSSIFGTLVVSSELQVSQWLMNIVILAIFHFILPLFPILSLKSIQSLAVPLRMAIGCGFLAVAVFMGNGPIKATLRDTGFEQEVTYPSQLPKTKLRGPKNPPNVALIVMDTSRAANMSLYGYQRPTTPNLEKLAKESTLFTNAISSAPWTLPSHATLFTGLPSYLHFATYGKSETEPLVPLSQGYDTLAEILAANGYSTGAVVANTAVLSPRLGLNQGFSYHWWGCSSTQRLFFKAFLTGLRGFFSKESIDHIERICGIARLNDAQRINLVSMDWLERHTKKNRPWFLFINYMETHGTYYLPAPYSHKFTTPPMPAWGERDPHTGTPTNLDPKHIERIRDWYDNEMAYLDHQIGLMIKALKARNLYTNTLIIITSDHGELMGEHGETGHGFWLYQELLHVPLLVKYPYTKNKGIVNNSYVQNSDIFAEILKVAGIVIPKDIYGQAFDEVNHKIFSEAYRVPASAKKWPERYDDDLKAIISKNHVSRKLIHSEKGKHELFDVAMDPQEKQNLMDSEKTQQILEEFKQFMSTLIPLQLEYKKKKSAPPPQLDKDTMDRLRTLGYVD